MTQRKIQYWVIPPKANAEFTAHMENVLDTYAQPYNPRLPIVCMDEQPVQLLKLKLDEALGKALGFFFHFWHTEQSCISLSGKQVDYPLQ